MIKISVCMIVKNEERILERCLDSLLPIADEIIIVDTGSTDNTKKIAEKYTDKIFDFKWTDNFSEARNFSFSQATMDYIYTADADEVIDETNLKAFLQLKECLLPEIDIVQMIYVTSQTFNSVYNFQKELRPKLFKRLREFVWISPIHETIRLKPLVYDSEIEILHYPETSHSKRDFKTFIKAVNQGIYLENYVVDMFCKELYISGDDEDFLECTDCFTKVFKKENRDMELTKKINCILAKIYRLTNNYNEFFKICLKDVAMNPCSEICCELAKYYFDLGDYDEAILWYINASSETQPILNIHSMGDIPLSGISRCFTELSLLAKQHNDNDLEEYYKKQAVDYLEKSNAFEIPESV